MTTDISELIPRLFAPGIISNSLWLLDNSAKKTSMRFAFEVSASLRPTNFSALRF